MRRENRRDHNAGNFRVQYCTTVRTFRLYCVETMGRAEICGLQMAPEIRPQMMCRHEPGRGAPEADFRDRTLDMLTRIKDFFNAINGFGSAQVLGS